MQLANIKIPSQKIKELKKYTGAKTGQGAIEEALVYYLKHAKQRKIIPLLQKIQFEENFNPLHLRKHER